MSTGNKYHKQQVKGMSTKYINQLIRRAGFNGKITPEMQSEKRRQLQAKRKNGTAGGRKTRGGDAAFSTSRYCYYFIEDGECSLQNPIVWKRLCQYVYRLIRFTGWIKKKNFIDAEEVLAEVQQEIKDIPIIQYGNENEDAITFLIKKINTQVGREWWKYLKTNNPREYDRLIVMQKNINKFREPDNKTKKYDQQNVGRQQKYREELNEGYLIGLVYSNLKNQTGIKHTFDEIREQYPYLIEQKRALVLRKRNLPK